MKKIIDELCCKRTLSREKWVALLSNHDEECRQYAYQKAREIAHQQFENKIYIRGLIEFSNYCKQNCLYCGLRRDNENLTRYRLHQEDIVACCKEAYDLGFRTFVMQSGEDDSYRDEEMIDIISSIKQQFPDCAITLSMGEKTKETYQKYCDAGADRYLLRHETSDASHYQKLHPKGMNIEERKRCVYDLKEIGFQVGSGMMIGSPYQTIENLVDDFCFLQQLQPHMIGIGPYLPHIDTPFKNEQAGDLELTLFVLALLRMQYPNVLLPSTTALASLVENGRELGILAGANVVMPNISPKALRKHYSLYNNKASMGSEAKEGLEELKKRLELIGYEIVIDKGDYKKKR